MKSEKIRVRLGCIVICIISTLVLYGYAYNKPQLACWFPDTAGVAIPTAVMFIIVAVMIWILTLDDQ